MKYQEFKNQLLKDPEFKKEYEKFDLKHNIASMIIDARIKKEITQTELAIKVGTKQPSIARLENGKNLPSLNFLEKIAKSLKTKLIIKFDFTEEPINVEDNKIYGLKIETSATEIPNFNILYAKQSSVSLAFTAN